MRRKESITIWPPGEKTKNGRKTQQEQTQESHEQHVPGELENYWGDSRRKKSKTKENTARRKWRKKAQQKLKQ